MVRIEIVSDVRKKMEEDDEYVKAVTAGKVKIDKERAKKTIVTTPELFSKLFSPERMKLLMEIRNSNSRNIYQLAKALGRSYPAVHRDITFLEGFGIIKMRTYNKKRYPHMEAIQIPVFAKA